jgi:hypothetical protein
MIGLLAAVVLPVLSASADANGAVKLATPGVEYRINEAGATSSPWIDANGWRILRQPDAQYFYDVPAKAAALAAAEAYAYSAKARIHTEPAGSSAFNAMLEFLRSIPERGLPAIADIGVVDDGSEQTGEVMNLLSRRNLLYRPLHAPDPNLKLNVKIGSKEYPASDAEDPFFLAQKIRGDLGDENRSLRVYGSEVVIARLFASGDDARVYLLNYGSRRVLGMRVRVTGEYRRQTVLSSPGGSRAATDVSVEGGATEFSLPSVATYTVIDLSR